MLGGDTAVVAGGRSFANSALRVQGDAQHFVSSLLYVAEVGECLCQILNSAEVYGMSRESTDFVTITAFFALRKAADSCEILVLRKL